MDPVSRLRPVFLFRGESLAFVNSSKANVDEANKVGAIECDKDPELCQHLYSAPDLGTHGRILPEFIQAFIGAYVSW